MIVVSVIRQIVMFYDVFKENKSTGPWFNINMPSYQYRKSHCGDETILRPSYLHSGISCISKTTFLYWIGPQLAYIVVFMCLLPIAWTILQRYHTTICVIGHVALAVITGTAIRMPYISEKLLQLVERFGMRRFDLWDPALKMSESDLPRTRGYRDSSSNNNHQATCLTAKLVILTMTCTRTYVPRLTASQVYGIHVGRFKKRTIFVFTSEPCDNHVHFSAIRAIVACISWYIIPCDSNTFRKHQMNPGPVFYLWLRKVSSQWNYM